jgi:hypothetical protein
VDRDIFTPESGNSLSKSLDVMRLFFLKFQVSFLAKLSDILHLWPLPFKVTTDPVALNFLIMD